MPYELRDLYHHDVTAYAYLSWWLRDPQRSLSQTVRELTLDLRSQGRKWAEECGLEERFDDDLELYDGFIRPNDVDGNRDFLYRDELYALLIAWTQHHTYREIVLRKRAMSFGPVTFVFSRDDE